MDKDSEEIVNLAIARMKSDAVVKEERVSIVKLSVVISVIATALIVYLTYDSVSEPGIEKNAEGIYEITIKQDNQGHYLAKGTINGHPVTFLVDTGATNIAIPAQLIIPLGIVKGEPVWSDTANGRVKGYNTRVGSIRLGNIEKQSVRATILPSMHSNQVLLGMSFLGSLKLVQEGRVLRISRE